MNWIGGARARAKLREQSNFGIGNRQRTQQQQQHLENTISDDETEDSTNVGNDQIPGFNGNGAAAGPGERSGTTTKRKGRPTDTYAKTSIDYSALGYRALRPPKVQRRVVPLLEFIEKKFPNGHVLSLQLSHLMDITSTPTPSRPWDTTCGNFRFESDTATTPTSSETITPASSGRSGVTSNTTFSTR